MSSTRPGRRSGVVLPAAVGALALLAIASPHLTRAYWRARASNPVRRGIERGAALGCFACHGPLGAAGVPSPAGPTHDVPAWSGGVWMMYVDGTTGVRRVILDGSAALRHGGVERVPGSIAMPAYRDALRGSDLDDLVAAFAVLSGMAVPPPGPARRGLETARRHRCFACHGPAGSGGVPNPGSFAGFVPGWYGPDFRDLVRGRTEFARWIRDGGVPRLRGNPIARFFLRRQRLAMPTYSAMSDDDLDALWAYASWLEATDGGWNGAPRPF